MGVLVLGLYAEGRTDERFLPIIIRRTAEQFLLQHKQIDIDVLDPIIVKKQLGFKGERMRFYKLLMMPKDMMHL